MSGRTPCIVSIFRKNIDINTVQLQAQVVNKFAPNIKHYQFQLEMPHGVAIDYFWSQNGVAVDKFIEATGGRDVPQGSAHDAVLILDIDAIPLNERAIQKFFDAAYAGKLIGNAQRSNHLDNGQHLFAASSCACLTLGTFVSIGRPSAYENPPRSDVLEEYTWAAEEKGVEVELLLPKRYERPPVRFEWEGGDQPDYWQLKDGMPKYGVGTTFGDEEGDLFYHQFQIAFGDHQEMFQNKCREILNDFTPEINIIDAE
jgi:hypothetical protein